MSDHWRPIQSVDLELSWLPETAASSRWAVFDVWNMTSLGDVASSGGKIASGPLDVHDSRLYLLSPKTNPSNLRRILESSKTGGGQSGASQTQEVST